jgi:tetratricopeptide (TPR) repeat protein
MTSSHDKTRQGPTLPETTYVFEPGRRLNSWKEVAAYFGRTDRTVMRWEVERGLPIHRVPGMPKSRIYAEVVELEAWRRGAQARLAEAEAAEHSPAEDVGTPAAPARSGRGRGVWIAAGLVALAAIGALGLQPWRWGAASSASASSPPPLAAQRLYVAGMDDWERRTPASLNRAVGEFGAAIALYPRYAEAYAGLAYCYDLLREYTLMPETQSYSLAKAAAERALALNDRIAAAHAALAFADYFGFWDTADARAHFRRAVDLEPNNETVRHWYASFLLSEGDGAGALEQIKAAMALDPASPTIQADRALILVSVGQTALGVAELERLARDDPTFLSPHRYLADHALLTGGDSEFLRQATIAAELTSDGPRLAVLAAARKGLNGGGRLGMLRAMYEAQGKLFEAGLGKARDKARIAALMGDRKQALADLGLAIDRHEADLPGVGRDPVFRPFVGDPAFQRLFARLGSGG